MSSFVYTRKVVDKERFYKKLFLKIPPKLILPNRIVLKSK